MSAQWPPQPGDAPGNGQYILLDQIGQGDNVDVWSAMVRGTEVNVALKILPPTLADDDDYRAHFARLADTLAALEHDTVLRFLDQHNGDPPFTVVELSQGEPLSGANKPISEVLGLFIALLDALAPLHAQGLLHIGLRPKAVRVSPDNTIKLLSAGIVHQGETVTARLNASPLSRLGGMAGREARYMSPELARGDHAGVGPASDLYAVGVMLYEALCGQLPFVRHGGYWAQAMSHAHQTPDRLPVADPALEPLADLLQDLLAKDYHQRPESAVDLQHRLQRLLDHLPADVLAIHTPDAHAPPTEPIPPAPLSQWDEERIGTSLAIPALPLPGRPTSLSLDDLQTPWNVRIRQHQPTEGRQQEWTLLLQMLHTVCDGGDPQGMVLVGEDGMGKRRLARALVHHAKRHALARVLHVPLDCSDSLMDAMRLAFYRHLRLPELTMEAIVERAQDVLRFEQKADAKRLAAFLCSSPLSHKDDADPLQSAARFWRSAIRQLISVPHPRPLLVWFDGGGDEHWADTTSWAREMLQDARFGQLPLCFIWSPRTDGDPTDAFRIIWRGENIHKHRLEPLTPDALTTLAQRIEPRLTAESAAWAAKQASGNPGLLRQTLRLWRSTAELKPQHDGRIHLNGLTTTVPSGIDDALRRRLGEFLGRWPDPMAIEQALKRMALLGPTFSRHMAAQCLQNTQVTPEILVDEGWLVHRALAQEPQLVFSSPSLAALVVENAVGRGEIPKLLPECIEVALWGSFDAMVDRDWDSARRILSHALTLLDQHAQSEQDTELRLQVLDMLGHMSLRRQDPKELTRVVQHCRLLASAAHAAIHPRCQALASFWDAHAMMLDGRMAEAEGILGLVAGQMGHHAPTAAALTGFTRGELALERRDTAGAERFFQDARTALKAQVELEPSQARTRLLHLTRAEATRRLAAIYDLKANHALASRLLNRAMSVYQEHVDPHGEAQGYVQLTSTLRKRLETMVEPPKGEVERVRRYWNRLSALTSSLGQRAALARVVWEGACICELEGELERARRQYQTAARYFEANANPMGQARCVQRLGHVARKSGLSRTALEHYEDFRALGQKLNNALLEANALMDLAMLSARLGDKVHADAYLKDLLMLPGAPKDHKVRACVLRARSAHDEQELTLVVEHLKAAAAHKGDDEPIKDQELLREVNAMDEALKASSSLLARAARSLLRGLRP